MEFLYGTLEQAPEGFTPPEAWPEYMQLVTPPPLCAREYVGTTPRGIRWSLWPFTFEDYVSDKEPDLKASRQGRLARSRVITWERLRRTDIPPGWMQFSKKPFRIDGVMQLKAEEDYTSRWNKNVRRDLRLFKDSVEDGHCTLEQIPFSEYEGAYRQSIIAQRINTDRVHALGQKLAHPIARDNTELWGVRDAVTKKIIAGTAVIYSPSNKISTHFAPFILPEAREVYAATGLIDHWFSQSIKKGCTYAMTTSFWFKGEPDAWKGFSEFKSHFGFTMVRYPPVLYKFVLGKIW